MGHTEVVGLKVLLLSLSRSLSLFLFLFLCLSLSLPHTLSLSLCLYVPPPSFPSYTPCIRLHVLQFILITTTTLPANYESKNISFSQNAPAASLPMFAEVWGYNPV